MAKFGINDILNAKTKAAGQQAQRAALLKAQQRVMQKRLMQKPGMRIS